MVARARTRWKCPMWAGYTHGLVTMVSQVSFGRADTYGNVLVHSIADLYCTVLHTPKSLPSEICKYSITVFKQRLKILLKMKRKRK
jgi:hypothetical protein